MSYEPTNWKTGDVVTSAKLNKLEEGVATVGMVVPVFTIGQDEAYHCNVAFNELLELITSGKVLGALEYILDDEDEIYGSYTLNSASSESITFNSYAIAPNIDDLTTIKTFYYRYYTLLPDESVRSGIVSKVF